jgi:pimeloyl-ACP methyl ester carboxylesterase
LTASTAAVVPTTVSVHGVRLELLAAGRGQPLLVLHDYDYLNRWQPYLAALAASYRVLAPSHPGFGTSELPPEFDSVDDLALLYLELLRGLDERPAHLVGLGFGGWVALELAVRCSHDLDRLVLVNSLGVKHGGRTDRDIADTFILPAPEVLELTWHDPALGATLAKLPGLDGLDDEELVTQLRNRHAVALYGWKPFLHNPKLKRWLGRIDRPTLVLWGKSDRLVCPDYGRALAQAIPGASFELLPAAGHYPYLEQPDAFVASVQAFLAESD